MILAKSALSVSDSTALSHLFARSLDVGIVKLYLEAHSSNERIILGLLDEAEI